MLSKILLETLLLEVDFKKIVTQKMGLGEKVFDIIRLNIDKKYIILVANYIKKVFDRLPNNYTEESYQIDFTNVACNTFNEFKNSVLSDNNRPKMDLKELSILDIRRYTTEWNGIKDYRTNVLPTPVLTDMTWEEAYNKSVEWHESIKVDEDATGISKDILEVAPNAEIIHKFDDGYVWIDVHESSCRELGKTMGHCATTNKGDTLLNLVKDKFVVTVAFDYDGTYWQMKGTNNTKPMKYAKYIEWLFTNEGDYQLEAYKVEYQPENDFKVDDLEDKELVAELKDKYPALAKRKLTDILNSYKSNDEIIIDANDYIYEKGYHGTNNIIEYNGGNYVLTNYTWKEGEDISKLTGLPDVNYREILSLINKKEQYLVQDMLSSSSVNRYVSEYIDKLYPVIIKNAKQQYGDTILKTIDWKNIDKKDVIDEITSRLNIKETVQLLSPSGKILDKELVRRLAYFYEHALEFIGFSKSSDEKDESYYANVYIDDYGYGYYEYGYYEDEDEYSLFYDLSSEAIADKIYNLVDETEEYESILTTEEQKTFSKIKRIYNKIDKQEIYDELDEEEKFKLMCTIFANGIDVDSLNKTWDLETIFAEFITKKLLTMDDIKSVQKNKNPNQLKMFEQRINKIKKLLK